MIREAIDALVNQGRDLSEQEAAGAMSEIMEGEATPAQIGSFITALRVKGETVDEITGMARVMRSKALHVEVDGALIDTCGTGGDASGSFNVSTASAFVAAGAGLKVAKHGNRAMSSGCGSADVLEALGATIDLTPRQVAVCIREAGIGFMFAQSFHPAMRHAAGPRREIGIRTVFNILGPLTNPAGAGAQVLGVASPALAEKLALVLGRLGVRRAMVVHGEDGLDEISISAPTSVFDLCGGTVTRSRIAPEDVGLTSAPRAAIRGGTPQDNAEAMRRVFKGEDGPLRDFVLLNAAAALVVGGVADDLTSAVRRAGEVIDSGAAMTALERFVAVTRSAKEEVP
ncbi:MAG: anthranilate phosphoribosyltransferase [Chloroflexi bacterium]|nr:anthranilate phosphoribosyltransferase [Chloroflexota bacterium]